MAISDDLNIEVKSHVIYFDKSTKAPTVRDLVDVLKREEMRIYEGQIWRRKNTKNYFRVEQYNKAADGRDQVILRKVSGSSGVGVDITREIGYILNTYTLINPVNCIKCGTARARHSKKAKIAYGLQCWSCWND